uniref:Lar family restriction alleviation protein n=1 Tax=Aquabacterium sp. TaxID=1872578 RepID=UPI0035B48C0A
MSQEQLKPCPFCGGRAEFNEHTPECYFSKLADVKKAPKGDVACMVDLIPAWNTRATQPDHFPESGKMMKPDLSGFDAFDVLKQGRQALAPQPEQAKGGETGGLYEWSVDVHEDEDDGLTWINIRNPNDDVACASV